MPNLPAFLVGPADSAAGKRGQILSIAALIVANLIPLVGVLAFGWSVRNLLLLYWAENVVVGLFAVARMVSINTVAGLATGAFFCVHFGLFCFVHLIFVNALTQPGGPLDPSAPFLPPLGEIVREATPWAIIGLLVSHGVSFVFNFLLGGERKRSTIPAEMIKPYPRMAVLHIAIILGGWFVMLLGQPVGILIVLVLLKIGLDLGIHVVSHRLREATADATEPATA